MSQNQGIKDWIYDKMSPFVRFSSHVMPTWACAVAGIYACGSAVPCLCLVYALFIPCLWVVYGFYVPCMCLGYASSHVMPTLAWAMAGIDKSLMCRHRHLIFIDGIQRNHHIMNVFDVSCQGNHIGTEDI